MDGIYDRARLPESRMSLACFIALGALRTLTPTPPHERMDDPPAPEIRVSVDPRLELLSIVFRLAGNPEYNQPNSRSPYSEAVSDRFDDHDDHPAIERAREL